MTEQFAWGIFISVLVALLCFAFIVLVIWKFCTWVSAALDKSIAKDEAKKKAAELKTIEDANDSLRSNSFYKESLNRIRMLHNLPEIPFYKTSPPARYYKLITFETKFDATRILTWLTRVVNDYGVISVADYYSEVGEPVTYNDNKWGWTDLSDAHISRVPSGYIIRLGNPKLID